MGTALKPLDNSDAEIAAFDTTCERLAGFDGRLGTEWIDGYLTALAAGPWVVEIDEWLPRLCADAYSRAFADPEDQAQARVSLLARTRVLANHLDPESLLDAPEELRLQPLVSVWDDESRSELVTGGVASEADAASRCTGRAWAEGFFAALDDYAQDWVPADLDDDSQALFEELIAQIGIIGLPDDAPEMKAHLELHLPNQLPTREDLVDVACYAVQDLRVWWLDHAPRPPTRHVPAAPGRNDPCPCGSGKKYKRCHGSA